MSAENPAYSGGCGCGAVRYTISAEPIFVNNCHCTLCQKQTGSTSVVNAFFETDQLTVTSGRTVTNLFKSGTGGEHMIVRCADCGTALWSHYPRVGQYGLGVRAGTLDDPGGIQPDAVVFAADRMPWVTLPEGIPAFEAYYNPAEFLAADKFARLAALVRKKDAAAG